MKNEKCNLLQRERTEKHIFQDVIAFHTNPYTQLVFDFLTNFSRTCKHNVEWGETISSETSKPKTAKKAKNGK